MYSRLRCGTGGISCCALSKNPHDGSMKNEAGAASSGRLPICFQTAMGILEAILWLAEGVFKDRKGKVVLDKEKIVNLAEEILKFWKRTLSGTEPDKLECIV